MNATLTFWLALAALLLTCFVAAVSRAFACFSRHELIEICRSRDALLEDILRRHEAMAVTVDAARVLAACSYVAAAALCAWEAAAAAGGGRDPLRLLGWGLAGLGMLLVADFWLARAVGRVWGEALIVATWPLWRLLAPLLSPLTFIARALDTVLHRLAGRADKQPTDEAFEEEIRTIVSAGHREGLLEGEAREMIEGVMELRDASVSQIMTPRTDMVSMHVGLSLEEAVRVVVDAAHSRIPIYDKNRDDIVGILYIRDLLPELIRPSGSPARKLAEVIRPPHFVPETKPVDALLREFQRNRNHMAVVLDEYGGVSGLVTIEDVLEEIVGEIVDEYDDALVEGIKQIDEHTADVLARVRIDEINERLRLDLSEAGEFDTIGGYVFHELGRIPKPGEELVRGNVRFTVLDVSRRRIERVRIEVQGAVAGTESPIEG